LTSSSPRHHDDLTGNRRENPPSTKAGAVHDPGRSIGALGVPNVPEMAYRRLITADENLGAAPTTATTGGSPWRQGVMRLCIFLAWLLIAGCTFAPTPIGLDPVTRDARTAAGTFLRGYVDPDGRVVRRDQGGDTVSEGQAYALLLAQSSGNADTFARVWAWTAEHLQRPDGLFAYRADAARVLDQTPASDADVLIAWALLRASGIDADRYHQVGRRVAAGVLDNEVLTIPGTGLVLAAGPWATGSPATLNPSYWSLPAFTELGRLTGDQRWTQLAGTALEVTRTLTEEGRLLPPDWARVDGSRIIPTAAPSGSPNQVQYGLDAQRLPVWLAVGCDAQAHQLATTMRLLLTPPKRNSALALRLTGEIINPDEGALPLIATAAAAQSAGRLSERDQLLHQADAVAAAFPGYYQDAWAALGRVFLTTHQLDGCAM